MEEKVTAIVAEILALDAVDLNSALVDDLGADSIAIMEIVMALEEEFEVEVPTEAIVDLKSVADIIAYIEKQAQ